MHRGSLLILHEGTFLGLLFIRIAPASVGGDPTVKAT